MSELNQEEKEILEAFESGKLKRSKGIPYQTLVASVLHKYV